MDNVLKGLINAQIIGIQQIHDYWQVMTDKGGINIYNPVNYYTVNNDCYNLELLSDGIINQIIIDVAFWELKYLSFELDNKNSIKVSLVDNDYSGPEAFEIWLDTGEIIVG